MIGEDLSAFFDPDGPYCVACSNNGHDFLALLNEPEGQQGFEDIDVIVNERTITAPTADIVAAAIVQQGQVVVDGTAYKVRTLQRGGDGALTRVALGVALP